MDEFFKILSSSARFDKCNKKAKIEERDVKPSFVQISNHSEIKKDDNNDDDSSDEEGVDLGLTKKESSSRKRKAKSAEQEKLIHQEEIAAFRRRINIVLSKQCKLDCPDPIVSFRDIAQPTWASQQNKHHFEATKSAILSNIEAGKWLEPTPIQMQCLPALLERRDVVGAAPTGSGKSGAFIIPALFLASATIEEFYGKEEAPTSSERPDNKKRKNKKANDNNSPGDKNPPLSSEGQIRSLLLAPSRELASQIHREVDRLGFGKKGGLRTALLSKSNAAALKTGSMGGKHGLDVLVTTPLRLLSCMQESKAASTWSGMNRAMSAIRLVVLDEADRLLDASDGNNNNNDKSDEKSGSAHIKSFLEQIDEILSACPVTAVRALFSATIGPQVRQMVESILRNPVDVHVKTHSGASGSAITANADIDQKLVFVGREEGKLLAIRQMIQNGFKPPVIIFLQSKERAQALFGELMYDGVNVDVIHAGRTQAARDKAVTNFRQGDTWILICTDLCARGVDFKGVNMVINYDLPTSGVTYVHRIGRTGRAGRKGEAITYFTEDDCDNLRTIANVIKLSGCDIPDWMLSLKSNRNSRNRHANPRRSNIDTTPSFDKQKKAKKRRAIQGSKAKKEHQAKAATNAC